MKRSLAQKIFHLICVKNYHKPQCDEEDHYQKDFDKTKKFFNRFQGKVDFRQKTVLDVCCRFGGTCIYLASNGAGRVTGIDTDLHRIAFARSKLTNDYRSLSNTVDFRPAYTLGDEKFDIVLSNDTFKHIADPENFIFTMKQHLKKDGIMVIAFAPLWKTPYGGNIGFMTKVPWAHLLFPESVIMAERKRFRPDEDAESFEQVRGRLYKMTLTKYLNILNEADLEIEFLKTNISQRRSMRLFTLLSKIPFCQEFFTHNVYSIMRIKRK